MANEMVIGTPKGPIDDKRLRLPGVKIESECPKCGAKVKCDYGQEYLSYPEMNKPITESLCCKKCDHEYEFMIQLNVSLVIVEKKGTRKRSDEEE